MSQQIINQNPQFCLVLFFDTILPAPTGVNILTFNLVTYFDDGIARIYTVIQ